MPLAENLSLVFSEESLEENELRKSLGLFTAQDEIQRDVDTEMADSTNPSILPPYPTSIPLFKTTPTLSHPVPPAPPKPDVNRLNQTKIVTSSEPPPAPVQEAAEPSPSDPARSTVVEPPKPQISKPLLQRPQAEVPDLAPKVPTYTMPNPKATDEDEDMPAIDMESDSDIE